MATCYILYSHSLDKFYIGATQLSTEERLNNHVSDHYGSHFTSTAKDWQLHCKIECQTFKQARNIEIHLKKMKSRKYLQDLLKYPEITEKLLKRYNP